MIPIRQLWRREPGVDVDAVLEAEISRLEVSLEPGMQVALALGSRGISGLLTVVTSLLRLLRRRGINPVLVPAMGSHGGASPDGQLAVLHRLGVNPDAWGMPVEAGMEVRRLGITSEGVDVFWADALRHCNAVILVNRIKPHTSFHSDLGSGLTKMLVVGLGKHAGAKAFHAAGHRLGFGEALKSMARIILPQAPAVGGIGIVENQRQEIAALAMLPGRAFLEEEPPWLERSRHWMPRLPFRELDLLVVDEMGKDISGTGMDPHVIGRSIHGYSLLPGDNAPPPQIRRIVVLGLSPGSLGNAVGLGMADFVSARLAEAVDFHKTYTNALTAMSLQGAKIPITLAPDQNLLQTAMQSIPAASRTLRIARIRNTLDLEYLEASTPALHSITAETCETTGPPAPWEFTPHGDLKSRIRLP